MAEEKTQNRDPGVELSGLRQEQQIRLPAVIEPAARGLRSRWRPRLMLLALLVLIGPGIGIGWFWWQQQQARLPPGFASGNGRLESDQIDIDTKYAGGIANLFVDEGDMVA